MWLLKKVLLMILAVVVLLQLIPVDRSNPEYDEGKDFLSATQASTEVTEIVKAACYDCHSHQTVWPWYAYVAPASWVISNHVEEGRDELNFSEWTEYETGKKDHKLEECIEALTEGWMPEQSYVRLHKEAKLTDEQRAVLVNFFKETRAQL